VNQASAAVSVFNTSLLNCSVAGGAVRRGSEHGIYCWRWRRDGFPGSDGGGGVAGRVEAL